MHEDRSITGDTLEITVGIGNEIKRYGVEQIAKQLSYVKRVRCYDTADAAMRDNSEQPTGLIIVSLDEVMSTTGNPAPPYRSKPPKVLSLVDTPNVEHIAHAFESYNDGFLSLQGFTVETLHSAITRIRCGEIPIPANLTRALLTDVRTRSPNQKQSAPVHLTQRENAALHLLVDGMSNKQIANRLSISEHGAKRLVANVLAKLNAPNRTTAVAKALREQLCVLKDTEQF
ncbi:DNA-binding NarL/FixJ family response regulator [Saccharopolyspora lacisalsi]|uniref:DNA-binding NarL/FixJ family response regulator n=1 Tax=Halosaccharopolyspora lacisalsi TaxID=1000566 RepID=A0A839DZ03_9PSEU|nr:response regulator transcription factor [Halosaccharopolyspora lacisalsi]MBA8826233.1 DNA-binding NarL/FixJ family response regulator [Halosaccharopolyspora lacisalsi]